jgi:uncharacterized protein (DUF58 family)
MVMNRPLLLAFLVYSLALGGLGLLNERLMVLAVPLLVYMGVALYRTSTPAQLRVGRRLNHHTITETSPVQVTLTVHNEGDHLEELLVEDLLPRALTLVEGETKRLTTLPPGQTLSLSYSVTGKPGKYELAEVKVTAGEVLGLFRRSQSVSARAKLDVMPAFRRLRQVAIRPLRTLGYNGPLPSRRAGAGTDFFGVRHYQPGDSFRRINWRVMARHTHTPFTTEFEQERTGDVGIILDVRRQNSIELRGELLLADSVRAAAALADVFLRDSHRVGLLLYGAGIDWIVPGYGKVQRERILRRLLTAEPGKSQVFQSLNYLPTRLFPPRSQLVFVSPLSPGDETTLFRLRAHNYAVLVVSPDPVSFEAERLPEGPALSLAVRLARLERQLLLQRLRQGGVITVDWQIDRPLDVVLYAALQRARPLHHVRSRPR